MSSFAVWGALVSLTVVLSLVPSAGDWPTTSKAFLGLMHFTNPSPSPSPPGPRTNDR